MTKDEIKGALSWLSGAESPWTNSEGVTILSLHMPEPQIKALQKHLTLLLEASEPPGMVFEVGEDRLIVDGEDDRLPQRGEHHRGRAGGVPLMSTSLVLTCPVHGADIEPFDIAGTKFCSLCLRDFLAKTNLVRELKMTEVEVDRRERASEILAMRSLTCDHCGTTWRFEKGTACPKCGKGSQG